MVNMHVPRTELMKPSEVNEMSRQPRSRVLLVRNAVSASFAGPGREGGRAAEHSQLSPDHARGKWTPARTDSGTGGVQLAAKCAL